MQGGEEETFTSRKESPQTRDKRVKSGVQENNQYVYE